MPMFVTQIITAEPDITVTDLAADDEFFILACDGVWDCLTNQQAVSVMCELCVCVCELCVNCLF
jgi:serine/threonine protein phosphatase PrpC